MISERNFDFVPVYFRNASDALVFHQRIITRYIKRVLDLSSTDSTLDVSSNNSYVFLYGSNIYAMQ